MRHTWGHFGLLDRNHFSHFKTACHVAAPPPPSSPAAPQAAPPPAPPRDIVALSDALGVSSAVSLGGRDMFKLKGVVDDPGDATHLMNALLRLSTAPMMPELTWTGIDEAVAQLSGHESADVRELGARITSTWRAQLQQERRRRELARRPGPKPPPPSQGCKACQGQHRPHTCRAVFGVGL